jgi:hypothetical protein
MKNNLDKRIGWILTSVLAEKSTVFVYLCSRIAVYIKGDDTKNLKKSSADDDITKQRLFALVKYRRSNKGNKLQTVHLLGIGKWYVL